MAWLAQFKLGRPGAESLFEINPGAVQWDMTPLKDIAPGGDGTMNATGSSRDRPRVRITGNYITPLMANKLRSIAMIDDTPLVFEAVNTTGAMVFESLQERIVPTSTTSIVIPPNSYTRGSQLRAAAGGATMLTPVGIWRTFTADSREGGGVNYFNSPTTYSEFFDSLATADLNGQVSGGTAWAKIAGLGTWSIDVTPTVPISGTKSARANFASGTSGSSPRYRRVTTFPATYALSWKMRLLGTAGFADGASMELGAWAGDAFTTGNTSWRFQLMATVGSPPFRWNIFTDSSLSVPVATGALASPATPFDFTVSRAGTTLTFRISGAVVHTATQVNAPDRMILGASPSTLTGVPVFGLAGAWDDLILSSGSGGGSYAPSTGILTPGTALPDLSPVYVTYQSTGIAALLSGVPTRAEGGWVDFWRYPDVEIIGA